MKMIKAILITCFICLSFYGKSKDKGPNLSNNFSFILNSKITSSPIFIGKNGGYRIVPIYYDKNKSVSGLRFGLGAQYTNHVVNVAFKYFATARYGHLYFSQLDTSLNVYQTNSTLSNVKGLSFSHNILITKLIKIKTYKFNLGWGYTWDNMNTEYSYVSYDTSVPFDVYSFHLNDFSYKGFVYSISYLLKSFELGIDIQHIKSVHHKYKLVQDMIIPSLFIQYKI